MSMKEAYKAKMEAQLKEIEESYEKSKADMANMAADAKIQAEKDLEYYREQRDYTVKKLKELQESSDDMWESIKLEVEAAWLKTQESAKRFEAWLKRL